jgi:hypothetical protein
MLPQSVHHASLLSSVAGRRHGRVATQSPLPDHKTREARGSVVAEILGRSTVAGAVDEFGRVTDSHADAVHASVVAVEDSS